MLNNNCQFPKDIQLVIPKTKLPKEKQHFLLYIPWDNKYLQFIPKKYLSFYKFVLPMLSVRTTDVHTAICLQYLDEFISQARFQGHNPNRDIVAYALILHDIGWSQLTDKEIANSLGVTGLKLNQKATSPKEKHAIIGAKIASTILHKKQHELNLTNQQIKIIIKAIKYHDQPEKVTNGKETPIEIKLLVDLDHIWSFTYLNFWQDTKRKNIHPKKYLENLQNDLSGYFVTDIGKNKATSLLKQRQQEVNILCS